MPDGNGGFLIQKKWILQVNRKANDDGKLDALWKPGERTD